MKEDLIAVMAAHRKFISGAAENHKILPVNGHGGVASGLTAIGRHRNNARETPVYTVFGKMQRQPVALIVRQAVPAFVQQLRSGHAVCRLGGKEPIQSGLFIIKNMKFQMSSRKRETFAVAE